MLGIGRLEDEEQLDRVDRGRPVAPARGAPRGGCAGSRARISRRPTGRSIPAWSSTPSPTLRRISAWQSSGVRLGRRRPGRRAVPSGPPTMKWPGSPMPSSAQPEPPGDLELDDREADRQADPARRARRSSWLFAGSPYSAAVGPRKPELAIEDVVEAGRRRPRPVAARRARTRTRSASSSSAPRIAASSIGAAGRRPRRSERAEREVDLRRPGARRGGRTGRGRGRSDRRSRLRCSSTAGFSCPPVRSGQRSWPDPCGSSGRIPPVPVGDPSPACQPTARHRPSRPASARSGPAPAGLPDGDLAPPVVAESGDPFTALRVIDLLARIERGRPIRLADLVDRLNATHLDWLFPAAVVADVAVALQSNWLADYRNGSGSSSRTARTGRRSRSRTAAGSIRGSSARPSGRPPPAASALAAFSRLDRPTGEG